MLEYEKKIPLTVGEFNSLCKILPKYIACYKQTNFYYDTDDYTMNRKGITYRIREKNGIYTATIKAHDAHLKDCNMEISMKAQNEFDNALFIDKGVKLQGNLITERSYLLRENGIEVVLDKNDYLGFTDYEIEIEYSPNKCNYVEKILLYYEKLLCSVIKSTTKDEFYKRINSAKSKSERFFERLEFIKNNSNNVL